jgi:Big-like domain-containing protein
MTRTRQPSILMISVFARVIPCLLAGCEFQDKPLQPASPGAVLERIAVVCGVTRSTPPGSTTCDAIAHYSDGRSVGVTRQSSWTSSDEGIAVVANGLVTHLMPGRVEITATFQDVRGSATLQSASRSDRAPIALRIPPAARG